MFVYNIPKLIAVVCVCYLFFIL